MTTRTLDQQRVGWALEAIDRVGRGQAQDYARQAKGLPAMLLASGLAPCLAFLESKKGGHALLAQHVSGWILRAIFGHDGDEGSVKRCLAELSRADSATYRRAEAEAIELAGWLKRFADAYLAEAQA